MLDPTTTRAPTYMSHEIEQAAFHAQDGAGWTGLGIALDADTAKDPAKIAQAIGLTWTVKAEPLYRKIDNEKVFRPIPSYVAQVRSDTGATLSITSKDRYHTKNRQPADIIEAFRDDFAKESLRMTHAASLMGGGLIVCCAVMPPEFDVIVGKNDRLQSFITLSTGYDKLHGTNASKGTLRVVCKNTLMASMARADDKRQLRTIRASTALEHHSLKDLIEHVRELQEVEREKYSELANAKLSSTEVARYFADVLEFNIEDLGKKDKQGYKLVSTRTENNLQALKDAYLKGPGAAAIQGTKWGALNAVTYYATHERTVRDTHEDGADAARVTSSLFGSAAQMKARALSLVLNRSKVAVAA
ncbi:MAG: DUF932 domain-containing protein [Bryobacteraceae bacterium]